VGAAVGIPACNAGEAAVRGEGVQGAGSREGRQGRGVCCYASRGEVCALDVFYDGGCEEFVEVLEGRELDDCAGCVGGRGEVDECGVAGCEVDGEDGPWR
jgi:hypothetical protein